MKKIAALASALLALAFLAGPARAEEKNPNKLFAALEAKFSEFETMGANFKTNPKFAQLVKYTCQKGNAFGGTFGVCRSGEGVVCGFKKEAYVACAMFCGTLAAGMKEADGFGESKCVTKQGKDKWGFADHQAAVTWAKVTVKANAQQLGFVQKLCPMLKKVSAKLPADLKEFAESCK